MNVLVGVAAIVAMFLILVVPHELGHFTAAKVFGVRVHEFAIGLGSKVFGFTRGGTRYALRSLPIAGYVQLAGMEPGEYDEPDGFHRKPALRRFIILLAGPMANFLVAALITTGALLAQLNAAQGMRPGDSVRSVDGRPVK